MPSLRSLATFTSSLLAQLPLNVFNPLEVPSASSLYDHGTSTSISLLTTSSSTCPIDSPLSCHNSTAAPDSCCFIYPSGQLLSTQFWDTNPPVGPADSWTLHGLWPDLCDGSYPTYCTRAPTYHNISAILSAANPELLKYMSTYWLPNRGSTDSFYEHEWNKHGTCINTLAPTCYSANYTAGSEVVDFFERAVDIFKGLDTYRALETAGIVPSTTKTYTAAAIQQALKPVTGSEVVLGCRNGRLDEVWYSFNVKGSLQTGDFVPTAPVGKSGRVRCPANRIKYLPKHLRN